MVLWINIKDISRLFCNHLIRTEPNAKKNVRGNKRKFQLDIRHFWSTFSINWISEDDGVSSKPISFMILEIDRPLRRRRDESLPSRFSPYSAASLNPSILVHKEHSIVINILIRLFHNKNGNKTGWNPLIWCTLISVVFYTSGLKWPSPQWQEEFLRSLEGLKLEIVFSWSTLSSIIAARHICRVPIPCKCMHCLKGKSPSHNLGTTRSIHIWQLLTWFTA